MKFEAKLDRYLVLLTFGITNCIWSLCDLFVGINHADIYEIFIAGGYGDVAQCLILKFVGVSDTTDLSTKWCDKAFYAIMYSALRPDNIYITIGIVFQLITLCTWLFLTFVICFKREWLIRTSYAIWLITILQLLAMMIAPYMHSAPMNIERDFVAMTETIDFTDFNIYDPAFDLQKIFNDLTIIINQYSQNIIHTIVHVSRSTVSLLNAYIDILLIVATIFPAMTSVVDRLFK